MYTVYHIECGSGQYIGISSEPRVRRAEHLRLLRNQEHHNYLLQEQFNLTGTFNFYEIDTRATRSEAEALEKAIIEETKNKLNLAVGTGKFGDGNTPPTHRGEVSVETREKLRLANSGKSPTQETRDKISAKLTGRKVPPEVLARRPDMSGENNPQYGTRLSEEERVKLSLAQRGKQGKPVIVDGVEYPSIFYAARELGIHKNTADHRLKSKNYPNYTYKE